eukprot:jgi/Botrbrau1/6950/Bobra.0215s0027.1
MADRAQVSAPPSGSAQDAFYVYKGRLSGSHTNLARVSAGSTEYHGLLSKPQAAQVDCGPDGVGTVSCLSTEGSPGTVYLGRLSGPRISNNNGGEAVVDNYLPPPLRNNSAPPEQSRGRICQNIISWTSQFMQQRKEDLGGGSSSGSCITSRSDLLLTACSPSLAVQALAISQAVACK